MRASKMFVILSEVRRGGRSRRTCFSLVAKQLSAPLLVLALTTTLRAQQPSTSPDDAKKDPILSAMLAELDRSKQHLQLEGFEKPYYIEYRLDDEIEYEATAAWGALVSDHEAHRRIVRVTARVGDYKLDSSGERGDASLQVAATENDPMALRYALWSATDTAYKNALNNYTAKQAVVALEGSEAAKAKDLALNKQKMARKQQGLCPICKNTLFNDEELHVHHKIPKAKGGRDTYDNLLLVHLFCHQQIHAREDVDDEQRE